jgi:hypothetical protein
LSISLPGPKAVLLLKERFLNLIMDALQPFFCARCPIAKMCGLCLKLAGPFLRSSKLRRKLMRQIHGPSAIHLRHLSSLLQQRHNGSPGVIRHDIGVRLPFDIGANGTIAAGLSVVWVLIITLLIIAEDEAIER